MTTPDPTAAVADVPLSSPGNPDAPVAAVPFGPSEIVSYLSALALLLNGYLGHDYGLAKNAQSISVLVGGLVVIGSTLGRAIKHHGAMSANASTFASQVQLLLALKGPASAVASSTVNKP